MDADDQLIEASQYGDVKMAHEALDAGANPDAVEREWSALMWATQEGHLDVVRLLITKGASVNWMDSDGFSPLLVAVGEGRPEIAAILLESGAHINARCRGNAGGTPLHTACAYGRSECVRVLLGRGADYNARDAEGHTALDLAKMYGRYDTIRVLEEFSAQPADELCSDRQSDA